MRTHERNESVDSFRSCVRDWVGSRSVSGRLALAQALQEAQVDQQINQGVLVGNGAAIAQVRALDAEGDGLGVDAFHRRALAIEILVEGALAIQRIAQAGADTGRHHGRTAALLPLRSARRTSFGRRLGKAERADVLAAFMFDETGGAIGEGAFQGHGQAGRAERGAIRREVSAVGFVAALFGEGHSGHAGGGVIFAVKIGVNVPGIKGGIERAEAGLAPQARFDLVHQRKEVSGITLVKGLGEFGDHELAPVGDFGHDDAGAIAPVVFADFHRRGGDGVGRGGRGCQTLIVAPFATEAAIGVTGGLSGLVETIGDIGLGVVLLHPGEDVFGVQRHTVGRWDLQTVEFGLDQAHAVGQQELEGAVGQHAQLVGQMRRGGQAGLGIKTQRLMGRWLERKTEQPYESGMLTQVLAQRAHRAPGFIQLDQQGGDQSGLRNGRLAPVACQVAFGHAVPVQRTQQVEGAHRRRAVAHKGRQGLRLKPKAVQTWPFGRLSGRPKGVGPEGELDDRGWAGHGARSFHTVWKPVTSSV